MIDREELITYYSKIKDWMKDDIHIPVWVSNDLYDLLEKDRNRVAMPPKGELVDRPELTEEQLEAGFHIWTEFTYTGSVESVMVDGKPTLKQNRHKGFEHWKKCPCRRDVRTK